MGNKGHLLVLTLLLLAGAVCAGTNYVAQNGQTPVTNYTSWATAASNIQDAINVATNGETVLVSNGVYQTGGVTNWPSGTVLTNRVAITKTIIVKSANNDPTNTIIKGERDPAIYGPAAVRCVYMINGSSLIGFTLTNGATLATADNDIIGGGVWCQSTSVMISNCIIAGNAAKYAGGGAYQGTLYNCTLVSNAANRGGGALESILYDSTLSGNTGRYGGGARDSTLLNCLLTNNLAQMSDAAGAGAHSCILSNCTLVNNAALYGAARDCTLYNCLLANNSGRGAYGGTLSNCTLIGNKGSGGAGVVNATLYNCLIVGNQSTAAGGGASGCILYNCTVVGNRNTATDSSWRFGGGVASCSIYNTIVYYNMAYTNQDTYLTTVTNNSCASDINDGVDGNITNAPMFVFYDPGSGYGTNHVAGNYRLAKNSPCINAGTNQAWMLGAMDIDGRRRLDKFSGQVDMGCYEYIFNGTLFSVP